MSDDADNEYFSDGLSEELLNLLTKIPQLKVASRSSSFSFKGKDFKIADVGRELNVAHVLEGSVRKSGDVIRITAQLIKVESSAEGVETMTQLEFLKSCNCDLAQGFLISKPMHPEKVSAILRSEIAGTGLLARGMP